MQKGCPFCVFLFLPQVSNFDPAVFQFERQTDIDCWYLGGKISEWERWTQSGNQFLSGQPLSAACRTICISHISAFVFLTSFHLYFFKLFLSICSTQLLLWHSIPFLLILTFNSLNFCKKYKQKWFLQEQYFDILSSPYNCFSPQPPPTHGRRTKYTPVNLSQVPMLLKNCTAPYIALQWSAIQCNVYDFRLIGIVMIAMVMKVMIGGGGDGCCQ